VPESLDEVALAFALRLYAAPPGRSRGIDRYARSAPVLPGSVGDMMLQALHWGRFPDGEAERQYETAGLVVQDLMRQEEVRLGDEHLEQRACPDTGLSMRLRTLEAFAITGGNVVPLDAAAGVRFHAGART